MGGIWESDLYLNPSSTDPQHCVTLSWLFKFYTLVLTICELQIIIANMYYVPAMD